MKRTILEKGTMKKGPEGLSASGKGLLALMIPFHLRLTEFARVSLVED